MKKKILKVVGHWDGNIFAIMGNTRRALLDAGVPQEEINKLFEECKKGDYSFALGTCMNALEKVGYEIS